jgi:hypothetical protein
MEITTENHYNDSAIMEVELTKYLNNELKKLDAFLNTVKISNRESLNLIIEFLALKYEKSVSIPNLEIEYLEFTTLKNYSILSEQATNFLLTLLNFPTFKLPPESLKVSVSVNDYLKSRLFFAYNMALSLKKIMSHKEAIIYFQAFVDKGTISARNPDEFIEKLGMMQEGIDDFQNLYQSHNFINFKINEGVIGTKTTKCKWHEVMKNLNDPDLCYAVACHYDFEAARNMNPKFELTRNKTLMKGDNCCDFCYHDTRIVESIIHPSEEFWENLL